MSPDTLKEIGLEDTTFIIYTELLRLGEQPVSVIARQLGLKRTTMYYLLERLECQGIVRSVEKYGMLVYRAEGPAGMIDTFRAKRRRLLQAEKEFREIARIHSI